MLKTSIFHGFLWISFNYSLLRLILLIHQGIPAVRWNVFCFGAFLLANRSVCIWICGILFLICWLPVAFVGDEGYRNETRHSPTSIIPNIWPLPLMYADSICSINYMITAWRIDLFTMQTASHEVYYPFARYLAASFLAFAQPEPTTVDKYLNIWKALPIKERIFNCVCDGNMLKLVFSNIQ